MYPQILRIYAQNWAQPTCFCQKIFLIKAIVSAELSDYFLSKNKDKFKPPHKYFHKFPSGQIRTRL